MDGIVSGRIVSYVSVHVYFSAKFGMWCEKKRRTETPDTNKIAEMRRKTPPQKMSRDFASTNHVIGSEKSKTAAGEMRQFPPELTVLFSWTHRKEAVLHSLMFYAIFKIFAIM